jgi:hypothetical protein
MTTRTGLAALERITRAVLVVRGRRVMLDREPAVIYRVTIKRLNEQVKRNAPRFPEDFVFQLNPQECGRLRSQFATLRSLAALDAKTQGRFNDVYEAIRALMIPPPPRRRGIGFTANLGDPGE